MYNVYLLSCGEEQKRYKIGYTKNDVTLRVKQLKTGNSEELKVERIYKTKWGTKIESILHRNYSSNRISGEWFELSDSQVENFLENCKNLEFFIEDTIRNSTFKNPKTILK